MDQVTGSFNYSGPKMVGLLAGGVILTIASLMIVTHVFPNPSIKGLIGGYVGLPFFAGVTILMIVRLFQTGPVVEVSTSGIGYHRWPQSFHVLWTDIANMSIRQQRRRKSLILQLRPQEPTGAAATRTILMVGLDGSFDDLLNAIRTARSGGGAQRQSA